MRIPVRAKIRRIEQAHTISVFWTLNLDLSEVVSWCLRKASLIWFEKKFDSLKWMDLIIKLRKPSAEHQFSYLYEQLADRFWEQVWGKFVIKKSFKDKLASISSPYSAATLILNEFFEACNDLTQAWQPPFECIEQKREISDKDVVRKLNETMKKQEILIDEEEVDEVATQEEINRSNLEDETILNELYEQPTQEISTIPSWWIPWFSGKSYTNEMEMMENSLYWR